MAGRFSRLSVTSIFTDDGNGDLAWVLLPGVRNDEGTMDLALRVGVGVEAMEERAGEGV